MKAQGLSKRRDRLWQQLQAAPFLRGSICNIRMACSRKTCTRCKAGTRHPATYLSLKQRNKTTLVYLPKAAIPMAQEWVRRGELARKLFEEVLNCNLQLLRLQIAEAKRRK